MGARLLVATFRVALLLRINEALFVVEPFARKHERAGVFLSRHTQGVTAVASSRSNVARTGFAHRIAENEFREADEIRKLTLVRAIEIVQKSGRAPPGLASMLQSSSAPKYASGSVDAVNKLNQMLLATAGKLDVEGISCDSFNRTQTAALVTIAEEYALFTSLAAGARTKIADAQARIDSGETQLSKAQAEYTSHGETCKFELADLEGHLKMVQGDLGVMKTILEMTTCDVPAQTSAAVFFECQDASGKKWTELRPRTPAVSNAISQFRNPDVKKLLAAQGIVYNTNAVGQSFTQQRILRRNGTEPVETVAGSSTVEQTFEEQASAPTAKCTIGGSPNCPELREKFMNINGGIYDAKEGLEAMISNMEKHCRDTTEMMVTQMNLYNNLLSEQREALAAGTKEQNERLQQATLKHREQEETAQEYHDKMTECSTTIENLRSETCALKKIRGELLKMSSTPSELIDCSVTDWEPSQPCSLTCGGGKEMLQRRPRVEAAGGSGCPVLKAEQSCNEDACPVDCALGDWSAWSTCTALCDGGVRQRVREVKVHPKNDGEICGEIAQSEDCNVHACNVDCVLEDWTDWSATCSKACGGGQLTRFKHVKTAALNRGTCEGFYGPRRFETWPCNENACQTGNATLKCAANMDVTLILDGASSVGAEGFNTIQRIGVNLSNAMTGNISLSSMLFSGPADSSQYDMCFGHVKGTPNLETDCGIRLVDTNSNDTAKVADRIAGLAFPQRTRATSLALSTAESELASGRSDAESVVIVITSGLPLSSDSTTLAATSLKRKARLMFVVVGSEVSDMTVFNSWASFPADNNVVRVTDFAGLNSVASINQIVSDFCTDVIFPPVNTTEESSLLPN